MAKKIIVIGSSAAAMAALTTLRTLDKDVLIICITKQKEEPYNKCLLADYVACVKNESQIYTHTKAWFEQQNITVYFSTEVTAINTQARTITTQAGHSFDYDALLLACGTEPAMPDSFLSTNVQGIIPFHTIAESQTLINLVDRKNSKNVAIVGAGFTGLECADALYQRGCAVTIIDKSPLFFAGINDTTVSDFLYQRLQIYGVKSYLNSSIEKIEQNDGWIKNVLLSDGTGIATDILIVTVGVMPSTHLAKNTDISYNDQGILTDNYLKTTNNDVYASGDNAAVYHQLLKKHVRTSKWADAVMQGSCAAYNMLGIPREYKGVIPVINSHFFGLYCMAGAYGLSQEGEKSVRSNNDSCDLFIIKEGRLKKFITLGQAKETRPVRQLFMQQLIIDNEMLR